MQINWLVLEFRGFSEDFIENRLDARRLATKYTVAMRYTQTRHPQLAKTRSARKDRDFHSLPEPFRDFPAAD
jgi:hypothetical protein